MKISNGDILQDYHGWPPSVFTSLHAKCFHSAGQAIMLHSRCRFPTGFCSVHEDSSTVSWCSWLFFRLQTIVLSWIPLPQVFEHGRQPDRYHLRNENQERKNFNRSWKAVLGFQWCWFTEAKGLAAVLRDIWFLNRFIWSFSPFVSLCHCFHTHSGRHGCVLQACCIAGLPPDLRQTLSLT